MMEIDKDQGKITIQFNKQFYDLAAVEESLVEFSRVCGGNIKKGEFIRVTLKPKEKKMMDVLGYEFCNYVLGLMKNKNLV